MALRVAKLATVFSETSLSGFIAPGFRKRTIFFSRPTSSNFTSQRRLDEEAKPHDQEFQKWCHGGGMFHKSACIDPTAQIEIGALVHSEAVVGPNVCIGAGSIVGPSVTVGHSTITGYNVVLSNCTIGDSCVIHHGVCIGQDGFGFYADEQGLMMKKPQIGHNVEIGKNCMLCGQVGIAGSVTIGDYVTLGGRASIRDHVTIASKVRLAANSCITKNITESGDYGGFPAVPINEWRKHLVAVRKISKQFQLNKNFKSPMNTSNPRS